MRQIEKTYKKGVLRKLLIKICRLLGYELIDQADMSFITSFNKENAILPDLIADLMHKRAQAKLNGQSAQQQTIKILMNSFYGIMGSRVLWWMGVIELGRNGGSV